MRSAGQWPWRSPSAAREEIGYSSILRPSHHREHIGTAGGAVGSVIVLVLLIILWPAARNWIINTFLCRTR